MIGYIRLRSHAIHLLKTKLSDDLAYHGIHHTYDVLRNVNFLIKKENISPERSKLLRIAALYHDIGFIETYRNHEEAGVAILKSAMQEFGCNMKQLKHIEGMIMATKIPQSPKNIEEKIICDADLFYLGRNKYYEISDTLFQELLHYGFIKNAKEWMDIQISFLSNHSYHTKYARKVLEIEKQKRVEELKAQRS